VSRRRTQRAPRPSSRECIPVGATVADSHRPREICKRTAPPRRRVREWRGLPHEDRGEISCALSTPVAAIEYTQRGDFVCSQHSRRSHRVHTERRFRVLSTLPSQSSSTHREEISCAFVHRTGALTRNAGGYRPVTDVVDFHLRCVKSVGRRAQKADETCSPRSYM
jgi:hypothetical protein